MSSPGMEEASTSEHDTLLPKTSPRRPPCSLPMLKLALLAAFLTTCMLASRYFDIQKLEALLEHIKADPTGSLYIFLTCFILGIVLMLPGMVLSIGAGAVYGFALGSIITWLATCMGQCLAFLLGRYLLRDFVVSYLIKKVPNFGVIEEAMSREGWKLVCLLRLSPLVPYNVLNYALSVTAIEFWSFAAPSALAIAPYVCAFVYVGSVSSSIVDVMTGSPDNANVSVTWLAVSAVMFIVTGVFAVVISRRALLTALKEQRRSLGSGGGTGSGEEMYTLTLQSSETVALHA